MIRTGKYTSFLLRNTFVETNFMEEVVFGSHF